MGKGKNRKEVSICFYLNDSRRLPFEKHQFLFKLNQSVLEISCNDAQIMMSQVRNILIPNYSFNNITHGFSFYFTSFL